MRLLRSFPLVPRPARAVLGLVATAFSPGCSPDEVPAPDPPPPMTVDRVDTVSVETVDSYVERGDLADIRARGFLRVVVRSRPELEYLPRGPLAYPDERRLAEAFADELGLEVAWVPVSGRAAMYQHVLDGFGDVALGRLPLGGTDQGVAFSLPIRRERAFVVVRVDETEIEAPDDLASRTVSIQPSSLFFPEVLAWVDEVEGLRIDSLPDALHPDEILHRLGAGALDVTVVEQAWVDVQNSYGADLRAAFEVEGQVLLAAALRPAARELRAAANNFLLSALPSGGQRLRMMGDLPRIRERGTLRLITLNGVPSYFMFRGHLRGFDYELVKRFALERGLRLEVVVAPSREDLLPWLVEGNGDVVASTPGPPVWHGEEVARTRAYDRTEVRVLVPEASEIARPEDLDGMRVLATSGEAFQRIRSWADSSGVVLVLREAPEIVGPQALVDLLAGDGVDALVTAGARFDAEVALRTDVRSIASLGEEIPRWWYTRGGDVELLDALNAYLDRNYRRTTYNVIRGRYFGVRGRVTQLGELRSEAGNLSPYDELVQAYAERYGFDWRMIVAQMYQESEFKTTARSPAGAIGLLQVMPETGREFGFVELTNPRIGIHAGVRYLSWVRDRFDPALPGADLLAFSFAAYNAGFGHVLDARRVAEERGWDPDRWFDNVERGMLLLSDPSVYRTTRFGYARGSEPVAYVRAILDRYREYLRFTDP